MFVGDLCLGEFYLSFGHGPKDFSNSSNVFSNVQSIFDQADIVVGNLEAPITNRNTHSKEPENSVLKAAPKHAPTLKKAGFKVLQVANNHTVQHSNEGFEDTLSTLSGLNISAVGLNNQIPVTISHGGLTYGFLAASDVPDNTDKSQNKYQRLNDVFLAQVKSQTENFDHLIVMLHWGLEASTKPLPYQRELVNQLYASGVSAIIGSHPHLFYEVEKRDKFICAYSLGNFVFDLCWDKRMTKTGILDLEFSKNDISAKLHLVDIQENGCLPTPTGEVIDINQTITPYQLGNSMDNQQIRKAIYFILNLHKGNTMLKISFFTHKIIGLLKKVTRA